MRTIVAYLLVSLDGVAEEPSDFITEWDQEMDQNLADVISTQDAVLLGRHMYEEWSRFWPQSEIEPFASFINQVSKHIVTSSELTSEWSNAQRVPGDLASELAILTSTEGGDIGVHGSIELTQSMLEQGLIDSLRLVVIPVIQGRGRKLFNDRATSRLRLKDSVRTSSGGLLLDYDVLR